MLPFLLTLGKSKHNTSDSSTPQQKTLQLQYGHINHTQSKPYYTGETANNLACCPVGLQSGHGTVIDKDFSLVFYQSNEVRTLYCFCFWMNICVFYLFYCLRLIFLLFIYHIG